MFKLKTISINILLIVCGLCASLLIVEGILRIYNPFQHRVRGDKIVLPVNAQYTVHNTLSQKLDAEIQHSKNSIGFRGPEPPAPFQEYLSILTVGGSTTECMLLDDEKEWAYVLSNQLKKNFDHVWVNNAGLDGHSTFGHTVLMRDHIIKIKPRIVLFLIGINDIGRDTYNFHDKKMLHEITFSSMTSFIISAVNHSDALTLILNLYRGYQAQKMGLAHGTTIDLTTISSSDTLELSLEDQQRIKEKHQTLYIDEYQNRLEELVRVSVANGIDPIFITQPALYGDSVDEVTKVDMSQIRISNELNGKVGWEVLEQLNDVTREIGEKHNVLVIDLARKLPKNSRYYYDWIHYSNEGSQEVAKIIGTQMCSFLATEYPQFHKSECPASI
jgi:lysophospholipase L1-like esterase